MLLELKVSNFAIIENIHLNFKDGLNILSGETGAGKSVLLKSLALLMGGKGSVESIRTGATQAVIEGSFDLKKRKDLLSKLDDLGIETEDKILIVRRVIAGADRSRVYLNGALSTLNALRDIVAPLIEVTGHTAPLIEMTGQHENRNLMSKAYHLDLLDQYCGTWDKRLKFEEMWNRRSAIRTEIAELEAGAKMKAQRLDFLQYQRDEIAKLDLSPGEDVELESDVKRLKNASRISAFVDTVEGALYTDDDSAIQRINLVLRKVLEVNTFDPVLGEKLQPLDQAKSLIEDAVYELRKYGSGLDGDAAGALEEKESRLSDLRKLQKKYGASSDEILQALVAMENEIRTLQNSETRIEELQMEDRTLSGEMLVLATDMHKRREKSSKLLSDSVNAELSDLNMKGVNFLVHIEKTAELTSTGSSDVEFMTKNSEKDPARTLSKAASGGELSRILLALKRVAGSTTQPRTYLFDEVDTGVSGPTAEKVGRKLKSIAKGQQVICVTHLPQVAAFGDVHFYIHKSPAKGSVAMEVDELDGKARVQEIARLISGEKITKTSVAHAQQLLGEAR